MSTPGNKCMMRKPVHYKGQDRVVSVIRPGNGFAGMGVQNVLRFHGLLFNHRLLDDLLHHFLSHDFSVSCIRQGLQVQ